MVNELNKDKLFEIKLIMKAQDSLMKLLIANVVKSDENKNTLENVLTVLDRLYYIYTADIITSLLEDIEERGD